MDIPSWHPANVGASAQQPRNEPRTEFRVMPGSSVDVNSSESQQILEELQGHTPGYVDPRGIYDASDRMYLNEHLQAEKAREERKKVEERKALEFFHSASLQRSAQASRVADLIAHDEDSGKDRSSRDGSLGKSSKSSKVQVLVKPKSQKKRTDSGEGTRPNKRRKSKGSTSDVPKGKCSAEGTQANGDKASSESQKNLPLTGGKKEVAGDPDPEKKEEKGTALSGLVAYDDDSSESDDN